MAVILAMRASSWAFCAAVTAASALAREWEVLQGNGETGMCERGAWQCLGVALVPPLQSPPKRVILVELCPGMSEVLARVDPLGAQL